MSAIVVTPPRAAPRVAETQPSHSVRPGSFTWTCASTTPGMTTRPRASIVSRASSDPGATTRRMVPSTTMMSASRTPSASTTRPPRIARSGKFDREVLRAFPEDEAAEVGETLVPFDHRREVVARELPDLARELRGAVREEDLHLADAARVDEDLSGRRIRRVVLEVDAQAILAHRHPGRLATPAHVHELALDRKPLLDGSARLRRELLFEPRLELELAGGDAKHRHRGRTIRRRWRRDRSRPMCSTRPQASPPRVYASVSRRSVTRRSSPRRRPTPTGASKSSRATSIQACIAWCSRHASTPPMRSSH